MVDDNTHMHKLVVTILQAFGVIQIFEAESGDRAWHILRESNPDVILLGEDVADEDVGSVIDAKGKMLV